MDNNLAADGKRARVVVEIYAGDAVDTSRHRDVRTLAADSQTNQLLTYGKLGMMLLFRRT